MAVGLVAVLGIGVWIALRASEPRYQGKRLTYWLRQLKSSRSVDSAEFKEAARAVKHIGTNALPILLTDLAASDPPWLVTVVNRLEPVLGDSFTERMAGSRRAQALAGLLALGTTAQPAIPDLAGLATNLNPDIAIAAVRVLGWMGLEECLPPMMSALTNANGQVRWSATASVGFLNSQAEPAVPSLIAALETGIPEFQTAAACSLGQIALHPQTAVPALERALNSPSESVRYVAALALGAYGTAAEAALPALRALPPMRNPHDRRAVARAVIRVQCEMREGGIIRGPQSAKRLALVFTAHEYAEGGEVILDELRRHHAKGSFFLTGDFLRRPEFESLVERIAREGHYVGPHSDKHLLYCAWERPYRTLVSREEFGRDLLDNVEALPGLARTNTFFLPAFEHYNREIADWANQNLGWTIVNYTPGTRANADYTGEADRNFVSSSAIFDSILQREREDPHGLNGFILLLHLGSGPGRADKFHRRFGELLDTLSAKGYDFVRVDELLQPPPEATPEAAAQSGGY